MKYIPPINGDQNDPNRPYFNRDPLNANPDLRRGSQVPAQAVEHPQRELLKVITASGKTPDENNLTQLLASIIGFYAADVEYQIGDIVRKAASYELYGSLIDDNTDNDLPDKVDDANWTYLGDLSDLTQIGQSVSAASNTESNAGTITDKFLTPGNFGSQQSLTANGYQKLPGGLILQWGVINSGGSAQYSFPVTFPNAVLSMAGGSNELSSDIDESIGFHAITTSNFSSRGFTDAGSNGFGGFFFAIGY